MNGENVPICMTCGCHLIVEHILIECEDFVDVRQTYYDVENFRQLFQEISVKEVFQFSLVGISTYCIVSHMST